MNQQIYNAVLAIIPLLFAITLHEVAHGWTAKKFGDYTAASQGRLTLNPINHIDPIGTVLVPLMTFVLTGMTFGWAKPVPVSFGNLRKPRTHGILVTAAGPGANLLMAFLWLIVGILFSLGKSFIDLPLMEGMVKMAMIGVGVNVSFMVFNLIPLLPLDGGRILQNLLPPKAAYEFGKTEEYGMYIVMGLALLGVLSFITSPIYGLIMRGFGLLLGLVF